MAQNMEIRLKAIPEDFNQLYESFLPKAPTYKKAYDMAEDYHQKLTGIRMYSDYESFRKSRVKRLRKGNIYR